MNLPTLEKVDISGKRVIVRLDLDVDEDYSRLEFAEETLDYLLTKMARLIIIGHKGRPEGKVVPELSLAPLADVLGGVVGEKVNFTSDIVGQEAQKRAAALPEGEILLLENLRFDKGEEQNSDTFSKSLAYLGEIYVNEALAVSHRAHASIVGIPKFLPHAAGFRFIAEVENLSRVLEKPRRPVVILISGVKEDKVDMAKALAEKFDKVLVGGKLPEYFGGKSPNPEKMVLANLIADGQDIAIDSIEVFKSEIAKAGTIVLAGVLGVYENEAKRHGTREIFGAVANSSAFKIAGGGDTEAALTIFNLTDKFDWISVGGGAMLEYLAKATLPGIEALLQV